MFLCPFFALLFFRQNSLLLRCIAELTGEAVTGSCVKPVGSLVANFARFLWVNGQSNASVFWCSRYWHYKNRVLTVSILIYSKTC